MQGECSQRKVSRFWEQQEQILPFLVFGPWSPEETAFFHFSLGLVAGNMFVWHGVYTKKKSIGMQPHR